MSCSESLIEFRLLSILSFLFPPSFGWAMGACTIFSSWPRSNLCPCSGKHEISPSRSLQSPLIYIFDLREIHDIGSRPKIRETFMAKQSCCFPSCLPSWNALNWNVWVFFFPFGNAKILVCNHFLFAHSDKHSIKVSTPNRPGSLASWWDGMMPTLERLSLIDSKLQLLNDPQEELCWCSKHKRSAWLEVWNNHEEK